jgi:hypothetical protein
MKLECIVTLASPPVRHLFLAMERSLRATGCKLPLWVIPFGDERFDLPSGSTWWMMDDLCLWLSSNSTHPVYRKYQCLTIGNYQFVDTDICFLRNPEGVLADHQGFVASCTHWRDPGHAVTDETARIMRSMTTLWQLRAFNSGQFACDGILHDLASLQETISRHHIEKTCLHWSHEQPAFNALVALSGAPFTNLTLPPNSMESTWAGDYRNDPGSLQPGGERAPYLIHWAGHKPDGESALDSLLLDYLTPHERGEYLEVTIRAKRNASRRSWGPRAFAGRIRRGVRAFASALNSA